MRLVRKSLCFIIVVAVSLAILCLHIWSSRLYSVVDIRNRASPEDLLDSEEKYAHISFKVKPEVQRLLTQNTCKCDVEPGLYLPLKKHFTHPVYSIDFSTAIERSILDDVHQRREEEYQTHRQRFYERHHEYNYGYSFGPEEVGH